MKFATRPLFALKPLFAVLIFSPLVALAAGTPDAGSILQQVQPPAPPAPSSTQPELKIEPQGGIKLPPSAPFEVKAIRIEGNTLFDTATLHALVADGEGKRLTLFQLDELAARITDYYHRHGYPLARAIIPAQTIRDGVLVIRIIEARYGKIELDNRSRVNDPLLEATLASLQSGQPIAEQEMNRALLLLSDIPGVALSATLKPGETVGTSDLLVEAAPGPTVIGNVRLDNYSNRYLGRVRLGGWVSFINPLHHGDVLSANLLSSGSGLAYGRVSYETLLNGHGTRVGGAYSALRYELGDTLTSLDAHGTAKIGSLWAKHTLMRGKEINLYGQLQYDGKQLRDRIDTTATRTDRHLDNWVLGLSGDLRGPLLSGGINTWSLSWTSGHLGFDDADAQAVDAATARTQGRFSKWNATFSRLQTLTPKDALYITAAAQWADANLDSAEKITVGGPYTVRAYEMGAASGDTGYLGTVEFRHHLGAFAGGQWQALAFVDSAHVTVNEKPWVAGTNNATLTGAGLGLSWINSSGWNVKAYIASRLGSTPELVSSTAATRGWLEIGKSL